MRGRDRSRDRYDGRRRSRSRSPRRYRSLSPRRDFDDDLPLPFRAPDQIPDIQVLVVNDSLPRYVAFMSSIFSSNSHSDYIRWVEDSFRRQGLRIDVLILSPRLSETAVVQRQILEGVQAIVKLNTTTLAKSKVNLQVFDRRGGVGNVQFNGMPILSTLRRGALLTITRICRPRSFYCRRASPTRKADSSAACATTCATALWCQLCYTTHCDTYIRRRTPSNKPIPACRIN